MHRWPLPQQIQHLARRAATRSIPAKDRYLESYAELLGAIQSQLPLNRSNLLLTAHAVYAWMPTQMRVDLSQVSAALAALNRILVSGSALTAADLALLASTFGTIRGNSVVSASKILHFLAPDRFPICDSIVARTWGLSFNGPNAAVTYLNFTAACHSFVQDFGGQLATQTLRQHLAASGYTYPMSDVRVVELILFLS